MFSLGIDTRPNSTGPLSCTQHMHVSSTTWKRRLAALRKSRDTVASQGDLQQIGHRVLVANVPDLNEYVDQQNHDNDVQQKHDNEEESAENEVRLLELEGEDPVALLEAPLAEDASDKLDSLRKIFIEGKFHCKQQDMILHWLREHFKSHAFPLSQKTLFKTSRVPLVPVVMHPGKYFHFSIAKGIKIYCPSVFSGKKIILVDIGIDGFSMCSTLHCAPN